MRLIFRNVAVPGNAYYAGLLHSSYDWAYSTVPQPGAQGRSIGWPGGKVLGGSSAVNGMYQVRPSKVEVDTLAAMIGSDQWNWDSLFAAMKKGENFSEPSSEVKTAGNIEYNVANHGSTGPLHTTYPGL